MQKQEFTTWFCKLYLPRKSELSLSADDSRINGNRRDEGLALQTRHVAYYMDIRSRLVCDGEAMLALLREKGSRYWRIYERKQDGREKRVEVNWSRSGLEDGKGWRNQERNDRLDSNQHFTACKTAPFRNIASSLLTPLTPRKFQSITALAWITCLDFLFFPFFSFPSSLRSNLWVMLDRCEINTNFLLI